MTTPSGAVIHYTYSQDTHHVPFPLTADSIPRETITQKQLTHDGTADIWLYAIQDTGGTVTNPDGSITAQMQYSHNVGYAWGYGKAGLTFRIQQPFTRIEKHWSDVIFTSACLDSPTGPVNFNPVVDAEYTTLLDATGNPLKMSAKTYQFDYNGNVLGETDYDWFDPALVSRDSSGVPTGVPGSATVLRTSSNSYYNAATSSNSGNVYSKRSLSTGLPLILNALQQTTTGAATAQFSYDGYSYGTAPTVGNLTSKSVWDDVDSKWISTSQTYNSYGNPISATDARGKVTNSYYDDSTHALPNRVVVDPQNGTGTQTTSAEFDFSTGLVKSQTDANGNQSTIDYTNQLLTTVDPFGRPGIIRSPAVTVNGTSQQHRVTTTYVDHALQVISLADLYAENDQLLKTRATADMLGRPVLSEQTEDGTNYTIFAHKAYDTVNRITYSSSPMRSGAALTDSWTRATSDALGRMIEVATFAGASQPPATGTTSVTGFTGTVTSAYDANFTTVTDQAGKQRRSMVDGAGRLVRVDEPDASNSLGTTTAPAQPTSYDYDVFGNLRHVYQGSSQTRTFSYDSLSRLRSAINPESGEIRYTYDDNGNLATKTDARSIVSSYVYDALNRSTSRSYSDSTPTVTYAYDSTTISNGKGRLASVSSSVSTYSYSGYDAAGKVLGGSQTLGSQTYPISYSYDLAGHVLTETYPSGRTVTNAYDSAGRTTSVTGNLGDGTQRTYSTGIIYDPASRMTKEQFGTLTPLYNKLFYDSRGQLSEIRESTSYSGPTDTTFNRGAIINDYSLQCGGAACNATDNNGNLRKQTVYVPNDDQNASPTSWNQQFGYDSLNRLTQVHEYTGNTSLDWQQQYSFDRYGNRSINGNGNATWGQGINNMQMAVVGETTTNRMYAPGETESNHPTMNYDNAGNQTKDTYSGAAVTRTYDAENRMTSETQANTYVAGSYSYDGDGRRVKRIVGSTETWQVYGLGGELLAEYAANAAASNPQKEYGYRNGQMLITAEAPTATRTNYALASNGATASASSTYSPSQGSGYSSVPANAIDGDRTGKVGSSTEWWNDGTQNSGPDWLQVDFNGSKTIDEIDLFTTQDNYTSPSAPTETMTLTLYGLTGYEVQYWNGASWTDVTGGNVSGNNKVWSKFTFAAITTSKIRVLANASADGWSRVNELEAWGNTGAPPPRTNVALSSNGSVATASSTYSGYPFSPGATIDGEHKGLNWLNGGGWNDATTQYPDWLEVDFSGSKTIDEIDVYTVQDDYANPIEPTETTTFSAYGNTAFEVQYWNGSAWTDIPSGNVTGNNKVWRKFNFAAVTTSKIKVLINDSADHICSRLTEVEAWGNADSPPPRTNAALSSNGGTATASSTYNGYSFSTGAVIDGEHKGLNWLSGGGWNDATTQYPDWLEVDFSGSKTIDEIDVYTVQDNYANPIEPTETTTFSTYGNTAFEVQYWNGSAFVDVPGGNVTGNNKVWRKFNFAALTTSKIKVLINDSADHIYSRLTEVEAWTATSGSSSLAQIHWLVADQLGTPRIIFDQSGALATASRHDYLPFGEELFAGTGGRTSAQGYSASDGIRQRFTQKERDNETGLDYFGARYYASTQGRFTGVDPRPVTKENFVNPQRWNQYEYVNNSPLTAVDPNGNEGQGKGGDKVISVFLDLSAEDMGTRTTTVGNKRSTTPDASDWQGSKKGATNGYRVDLYGPSFETGEKGPAGNASQFEAALKSSEVVVYVGHGRGPGAGTDNNPFRQETLTPGFRSGEHTNYNTDGKWTVGQGMQPKPDMSAKVFVNFSCDSSSPGGSYFNFTGQGQVTVTIFSGPNGVTNGDTLEKAANAFVNTYVTSNGDYQKAAQAANKVITDSVEQAPDDKYDQVMVQKNPP